MKFCAKIGSFILGIIIGIVLIFGGIGVAGFVVLTKEGMVGELMQSSTIFNPSDEVAEKSLIEYGQTVLDTIKKYEETTFGTIEDTVGINLTSKLSEALGLDADVLRTSTVGSVAENILNSYTIEGMQDKFGFTLPDLPMFKEKEFLEKPIKEAFDYISAELDFDTMTVRELNEKFGVNLGEMLSQESLLDTPINELGDKIGTLPLHNFVDITLQVEVDRYLAETVATVAAIEGVTYSNLTDWQTDKTAFVLAADNSNLGVDASFTYDRPEDFLNADTYFADVVDGEGNVVKTAKEVQAEWIAAYNAEITDDNLKVVEFWQYAILNKDIYDAATTGNVEKINEWLKDKWFDKKQYVTMDANWDTWYAEQNVDGGLAFNKTIEEAKDIYFEKEIFEGSVWAGEHTDSTADDYKLAMFDNVKGSLNYYDYMPLFAAPIAPTVVVTEVAEKDATAINAEYLATIPVASNLTLQYLYYAVIGSDGEDGLNAYMNNMTLADATEIKDTDHAILKKIKDEKIANIGSAVTAQINTMPFYELMTIVTDAEANYNNANTATTADYNTFLAALEIEVGRTPVAYTDGATDFDYFANKDAQTAWIAANNTESITYYDELEWEVTMALNGTQWFVDETARAAAYADYIAVNEGEPAYDDLADKNSFGVLKTDYNFAKPYAPTIDDTYVKVEASSKMLQAIRNSSVGTLNDRVTALTLYDIYGDVESGAMKLISRYTQLEKMGDAMTTAIQDSTMGALAEAGVLTLTAEQVAQVGTMTIQYLIDDYFRIINTTP